MQVKNGAKYARCAAEMKMLATVYIAEIRFEKTTLRNSRNKKQMLVYMQVKKEQNMRVRNKNVRDGLYSRTSV